MDFNITIYWCALGEKYFFLIEFTKATLYCSQVKRNVGLILGFLFEFLYTYNLKLCEERVVCAPSAVVLFFFFNMKVIGFKERIHP